MNAYLESMASIKTAATSEDIRVRVHHILGRFYGRAAEDQFAAADWAVEQLLNEFSLALTPIAFENARLKSAIAEIRLGLRR